MMDFNSVVTFKSIFLIIFSLIFINYTNGETATVELTTTNAGISSESKGLNGNENPLPKVQNRLFNWFKNGLNGQTATTSSGLNGFSGLNGLSSLGAALTPSNIGSSLNRFGASMSSGTGFNLRPWRRPSASSSTSMNGQASGSSMGMNGQASMSSMGLNGQASGSSMGLNSQASGSSQYASSQYGSAPLSLPSLDTQTGMSSNFASNGQVSGQANGQVGVSTSNADNIFGNSDDDDDDDNDGMSSDDASD